MPTRSLNEIMDSFGDLLDEFDQIAREAHARYRGYKPEDLIELDNRAQANCTYAHMMAAADRRFLGRKGVHPLDIRGLKLWMFEEHNAVIRLKKMDEDGRSKNYPTKQARKFDLGNQLPGLPMPPIRLTAGYLLDRTGVTFVRSQIAKPVGRSIAWCAAIVTKEDRKPGEKAWKDVSRQQSLTF